MENASKALLIAGAILIAILLISVGIMIYSGASGIFGQGASAMTDSQKLTFNKEFTNYEGVKTGSQVRALVEKININNGNSEKTAVYISGDDIPKSETAGSAADSDAKSNNKAYVKYTTSASDLKTYEIKVTDEGSDGLVDTITVTKTGKQAE